MSWLSTRNRVMIVMLVVLFALLVLDGFGLIPKAKPVPTVVRVAEVIVTLITPTATLTPSPTPPPPTPTATPTATPTPTPQTWLPDKSLPTAPPDSQELIGSSELVLVESQGQKLVCGTGKDDRNTIFCLDRTNLKLKRQIRLPGFVWGLASYRGVIYAGLPQDGKVFFAPLDKETLNDPSPNYQIGIPSRLFAGELIGSEKAVLLVPLISGFLQAEINKQDPAAIRYLGYSGFAHERGVAFNQVVPGVLEDGRGALFLVGRDGVEVYSLEDRLNLFPRFRVETVFAAIDFLPEWKAVFALTEGKVVRWWVGRVVDSWLVGGFADELSVCTFQPYLGVTLLLDPRPTRRGSFWLSCPAEDRVVYYDYNGEAKWQANGERPTGLVFDQEQNRLFVSFKDQLAVFEVSE